MQALQPHTGDEQGSAVHIREQDAWELQDVISRYMPMFYKRAYRYLGNSHDAEDAVQDALLSAYKHLHQFKGRAKMTTWLTSIVTNSALTYLRRRPRQLHLSLEERLAEGQDPCVSDRLADFRPGPEEEYARAESRAYLMQFVTELSPLLQKTIQLRDLDALSMSETADILGVPEGTIKARLSRARSQMKRGARKRGLYK